MPRHLSRVFHACVLLTLLAACTPTTGPTPTPTRTPPAAGADATAIGAPDASAEPPTSVPTTAAPSPTADSGVITTFPPDVNPLTGEKVVDPALLDRRPLAVKISNSPMNYVRPQSGVSFADLVFEHYAEGGVTRLTAIFLGRDAELIGPVRSGRMLDLELPAMFQSMFACSGYSAGVKNLVRQTDFYNENRVISPDFGAGDPPFHRVERDVPFEHTLFTSTDWLWAETTARGLNGRRPLKGMAFSTALPTGGTPVDTLQVNYAVSEAHVEWRYDATSGRWSRAEGGVPFTDALTGETVTAANVVVLFANHEYTDIQEDSLGSLSIQVQLWGAGRALIYRDGQQFDGYWVRANREDMLVFTDASGQLIPLKPGQTWFQVADEASPVTPTGTTVLVEPSLP